MATFSVTSFGAVPNDNGDDRPAILAAINASGPGDTIFFPAGTYNTSQEIFVKGNNRQYIGDSSGVSKIIGTGTHIFHVNENFITFKYLSFQGEGVFVDRTSSSQTGDVIGVVIDNNHFVVVGGSDKNGVEFTAGLRDSFITNNWFDQISGDNGIYGFHWNNLIIANNSFMNGNEGMHVVDNSDTSRDLLIEQNYFSNLHRMGIEYQGGAWNTVVQDNYYENPVLFSNVNQNLDTFAYSIVADRSHYTITRRNTAIGTDRPDGTGVRVMFELGGSNLECYQNYSVGGFNVIAVNGSHATGTAHDNRISNYLNGPYNANGATVQFANNGPNTAINTWDMGRGKPAPNHRITNIPLPDPPPNPDPDPDPDPPPPPPPPPDPNAPATPIGLAGRTIGTSQIDLTWADTADNEDGYKVERLSDDGVTWLTVGSLGANSTSFSMTGLTSGRTYTFRVRAYNGFGFSQASNTAVLKMPLPDLDMAQPPVVATPTRTPRPVSGVRGDSDTSILPPILPDA